MGKTDWQKAVEFHGHSCPGLAIGYKAAAAAKEKMGITFASDEEVVCVTENDACGVDAIQLLTGCSIGKGNLIYRGTGKMAFSFFNRKNGESLRMIIKPFKGEMDRQERQEYILNSPVDEIFDFMMPAFSLPETARIFTSVVCESCGESAPEHKMRLGDGKRVCLDCFKEYDRGWS
ncbi:MAG: FmdE family protein [Desulfitobacteriaceae bacterium]|nr:FmdE family protein [Desulfitobacteriaceae bacterium]MDD4347345.1 FmdE family protein [Desulfitobacteriaceae bacterium]MDD4401550.1 FmdE family protein [Desulfitobacteriaceae bacterium]